ncbi:ABC transporter ATP-binding protein [Ferrimonas sp. YFM]|uniref:ABC transporter ATP-binding protein n=1 Tax=Ferrimonas sp. YFM TaxID=3028878 RepID=UPI0025740D85|nr:ABC transporter ATP-binding protein [Ferrimonas sp. YFM]BDY04324.1 lipoprotein ABC transporter ATP-binding protein LolD [Ferrimonas sp. YFM]
MIRFDAIEKFHPLGLGRVHALKGVNGKVDQGEMVALCGPSGSGKSTLLNILGLLDLDYQGTLALDDAPAPTDARQATEVRRRQLGFVFQRFNLVPVMTALENVAYPLQLNGLPVSQQKRQALAMLAQVGLENQAQQRPDHLSGGQQQRVAIARALVHQPRLVIADEPTASLDSQTAEQVIALMKRLGRELGVTFIIATHDPRMANQCHRIINLCDGMIEQEGMSWAS